MSSFDLPDDVFDFEQGDVKPLKPKKKVSPATKKSGQKRSIEEVEASQPRTVSANTDCEA